MKVLRSIAAAALVGAVALGGCAPGSTHHAVSVVDYLYPTTKDPVEAPAIPELSVPLRVGIAFVPASAGEKRPGAPYRQAASGFALTEIKKMELMQEVANNFKKYPFVKDIELIPSAYLSPGGSFANLNQIRTMYGVDVIALLSFDQTQFTDEGALTFTYWTIVGAYVVPGEKNDTHTMLDAVVFDIPSRKMLFRAPGMSLVKGHATPVNLSAQLRADSETGFSDAAKQMIENLDQQLALFKEKVKERPAEYKVVHKPEYTGGGSLDMLTLGLLAVLFGGSWWMRPRA